MGTGLTLLCIELLLWFIPSVSRHEAHLIDKRGNGREGCQDQDKDRACFLGKPEELGAARECPAWAPGDSEVPASTGAEMPTA